MMRPYLVSLCDGFRPLSTAKKKEFEIVVTTKVETKWYRLLFDISVSKIMTSVADQNKQIDCKHTLAPTSKVAHGGSHAFHLTNRAYSNIFHSILKQF
jgi:hypothetical protein